jgi:hypothetical protein
MVVGTPHELDGVANGRVKGKRNIAEDSLCRGNDDGVGCASTSGIRAGGGGGDGGSGGGG